MGFKSGDRVIVDFSRDDHRPDGNYVRKQIGEIVRGSSSDYLIEFDYRFTDDLHDGSVGIGSSKRHWFCRADTISLANPELSKFKYRLGEAYYFGSVYQTCKVVGYGVNCGVLKYIIENQNGGSVGPEMTVFLSSKELKGSGYIYLSIDAAHSHDRACDTSEPLSKALASGDPIDSMPLPSWSKYRLGDQVKFKDGISEGVGRIVGFDRQKYYIVESDVITSDTAHELLDIDFIGPKLLFKKDKVRIYRLNEVEPHYKSPGVSVSEGGISSSKPDWAEFGLGNMVQFKDREVSGIGKVVGYLDRKRYLIESDSIKLSNATPSWADNIIGESLPFDKSKIRYFEMNEITKIKVIAAKPLKVEVNTGQIPNLWPKDLLDEIKNFKPSVSTIDHVGSMRERDLSDAMMAAMISLNKESFAGNGQIKITKSRYPPENDLLTSPVILKRANAGVKKLIITDLF